LVEKFLEGAKGKGMGGKIQQELVESRDSGIGGEDCRIIASS